MEDRVSSFTYSGERYPRSIWTGVFIIWLQKMDKFCIVVDENRSKMEQLVMHPRHVHAGVYFFVELFSFLSRLNR